MAAQAKQASYVAGPDRDPIGLPLTEIWLGVFVEPSDFAKDQPWPPRRGGARHARFAAQHAAARGDYTTWIPAAAKITLPSNPIGAYIDEVRSIMLASAPADNEPTEVRRMIRRAIGRAVADLIKHGRAVAYGGEGNLVVPDIRYAWPFDDDGWALVVPQMTTSDDADIVDVWTLDGETLEGQRRELSTGTASDSVYGTLGDVVEDYLSEPANVAYADRPDIVNGWGTPADDLIPLAVNMARRESGIDYAVDRNERPAIQLSVPPSDRGEFDTVSTQSTVTDADMQTTADAVYRNHNVLTLADGRGRAEYLVWSAPMEASFALLDRLDQHWTRATGSPPVESADSGNVESGVALARRKAGLVAKARELHEAVYDMLTTVMGRPFEWPYVDTVLNSMDETEDPDDPGDVGAGVGGTMRVSFE